MQPVPTGRLLSSAMVLREMKRGLAGVPVKDGPTLAKRRLLEHLGWQVIDVDFFEWAQRKTKAARKQLLMQKLANAKRLN